MILYVGNLPRHASEDHVRILFSAYGKVNSTKIILDDAGQPKDYGFIDMPDDAAANRAMQELHETEYLGITIKVMEARPLLTSSSVRSGTFKSQNGGYIRQF